MECWHSKNLLVFPFCLILLSCGPAFLPDPTTHSVTVSDVVGRWQYKAHATYATAEIEFFSSGDFIQRIPIPGKPDKIEKGKWNLDGAHINLDGFLWEETAGIFSIESTHWWLTDNDARSSPRFLIFGGDFPDPDAYEKLKPLPFSPAVTVTPTPAPGPTSGSFGQPIWVAFNLQSPVRSLNGCLEAYFTLELVTGSALIKVWQLEIRSASNNKRVLILPHGSLQPHIPGNRNPWMQELKVSTSLLPDGEYRAVLLADGKRCSNVVQLVIDSKLNPTSLPVLRVTTLAPWPDGSPLPLVAVQVTGPTPADPTLHTNNVKQNIVFMVDGVKRAMNGLNVMPGLDHALQPGETALAPIIDPNPRPGPYDPEYPAYYPLIESETPHVFFVTIGSYSSIPMKLEYTGHMEEEWDAK